MKGVRNWSRVALIYFVIAAFFGLLLRYLPTTFVAGANYKYLLHTHSHVALLGWAYLAGVVAILNSYYSADSWSGVKQYRKVLWFTNITVIGMMFSFPFQGYAAVSITFSTLFLFATYWFVYQFLSTHGRSYKKTGDRFIRSGLIYLVVSSIGPWALGPIIAIGYSHSDWYYLSIYFYLHFLYNGFFVMIVLGLFYKMMDQAAITYSDSGAKKVFIFTNMAVIPASLLSALWMKPNIIFFIIGFAAAVLQVAALVFLFPGFKKFLAAKINLWIKVIFYFSFLAYSLKIILQLISGLPAVASYIYETSSYTAIGYLHLVLLGFISLFIVGYFTYYKFYNLNKLTFIGVALFLIGLIGTEGLLFSQGLITFNWSKSIPDFHKMMFYTSILMPTGILLLGIGQFVRPLQTGKVKID